MRRFLDWLEERTGLVSAARQPLRIPGGPRWRHVWGTTVVFSFFIQAATGIALWAGYSPGAQSAWESVFHLQCQVPGGWLVRGLHHFNAQVLTVLLALHLMQTVVYGAYKAPRELNFWLSLALMLAALGASVTGWLLPWSQRGFWASKVPVNIVGATPLIGPELRRLLIGGSDLGNATLTRFFALHAGVLPATIIFLILGHAWLLRRNGLAPAEEGEATSYWPDQALRDAVACLAVTATVMFLAMRRHGAELGAPADPTENYSAARPEWFFLFLYQFLKYFPGGTEVVGAMVIPGALFLLVFLMPFIGRWRQGHRFNVGLLIAAVLAGGWLTWRAKAADHADPIFAAAKAQARADAERARTLALQGIPPEGALFMLRHDAATQGPRLFARYCASCHRYGGLNGLGAPAADAETASDLKGFGSAAWLDGLLDPATVAGPSRFGGTAFKDGKMAKFVKTKLTRFPPELKAHLGDVVAAVTAEGASGAGIASGRALFGGDMRCGECHTMGTFGAKEADATAPDLAGWGSREWLQSFIGDPSQERFYGADNDRMPAFRLKNILDDEQVAMLADWIRAGK